MRARYGLMLVVALACTGTAWAQASPADAVADAVANSGVFPAGTTVVSTTVDVAKVVVDLNAEAAAGLTDSQSDAMVAAIAGALGEFEGLTDLEVTAGGLPLWKYLPPPPAEAGAPPAPLPAAPAPMMMAFAMAAPTGTTELTGKVVNLHPSHGTYLVSNQTPMWWAISQRTLCGPNPAAAQRPPGWDTMWQSVYQPSTYYYFTQGFQWPSYYEDFGPPTHDSGTPEFIRFLAAYCGSSGATVRVSRELDKNAGDFDPLAYGYPAAPWSTPMYRMASMYNLRAKGYPEWIWSAFARDYDADIRARPYMSNYHMALDNEAQNNPPLAENDPALWSNYISFHLHTNAAGSGTARGTETYWYTSTYPYLQTKAQQLAAAMNNNAVNSVKTEYDGIWAEAMYPKNTPSRPEFSGTYRGYDHDGVSTGTTGSGWQNRGVKTGNYGEIREAKMPAVLMELLFHDDWKFYPDHVFEQDQIFRSTVAWGMYEGICSYFGVAAKPRLSATVVSVDAPALVGPNQAFDVAVTFRNNGQAWCWGHKFDNATKTYGPYTVWKLAAVDGSDPFTTVTKVSIGPDEVIMPGDTVTFTLSMTSPAVSGVYTTDWQMLKDDARGGAFGEIASTQITVDADLPEISILSPSATDYPYGCTDVQFGATDSSGISSLTADVGGVAVSSGDSLCNLALGAHTLTVVAVDGVGNTATQSVSFNLVNSVGKSTAGGWIELAEKKATCGITCAYVEGETAPTGSVTFQDHDIGMTVKAVELIAMGIRGNKATVYGTCTIDGQAGHWFRIELMDNGEPSTEDAFSITLDTGYKAGGKLGGGNITIH